MKRTLLVLLCADLLFLCGLLMVSAVGALNVFYIYAAVLLLPTAFALFFLRLYGEKGQKLSWKPTAKAVKRTLLSFPSALALCLAVSLLTIGVFAVFGMQKPPLTLKGGLLYRILYYALLPAVGEELLFRYLPLRFLSPYHEKGTLFFSAFLFSVAHADVFTIPYAFVMGVLFFAIDAKENSLYPSLFLHFCINLLTVFLSPFVGDLLFSILYPATVFLLGVGCFFVLFKTDKTYLLQLKERIFGKHESEKMP